MVENPNSVENPPEIESLWLGRFDEEKLMSFRELSKKLKDIAIERSYESLYAYANKGVTHPLDPEVKIYLRTQRLGKNIVCCVRWFREFLAAHHTLPKQASPPPLSTGVQSKR